MEAEQLLAQLVKAIKRRVDQLSLSITSGGVDNMETYKYIIGQINALESVRQEISNLQQDEGAKNENTGTVVDLIGRRPKNYNSTTRHIRERTRKRSYKRN